MSQVPPQGPSELPSESGAAAMPLLEFYRVIRPRKKFIASVTIGAMLVAMVLSLFVIEKTFEATASMVPPTEHDGMGLSGLLAAAGGVDRAAQNLGISLPGAPATPTDLFMAMVKSRVVADAIIDKFKLKEVYDIETMDKTRKALAGSTSITLTREKVIKITVEDSDPQRAADIANAYLNELDKLNQKLNVSKAALNRQFIEQQMVKNQTKIMELEDQIKDFQTKHMSFAMEEQAKAMVGAVAGIQSQLVAQEVQLEVMQQYLSPENPEIHRVRASIEELRKQIRAIERGQGFQSGPSEKGEKRAPGGGHSQPAIVDVPALAVEYGRLLRMLKVHETLYTLMISEFQQAKYSEARNTPTVQVLDPAVPPEIKSRPITSLNMLVAGFLGLACSSLWVYRSERKFQAKGGVHLVADRAA